MARAQGRPSKWINEEWQLTLALHISEPALPWDCQCLHRPSLSGHQMRLNMQTLPSQKPILPHSEYDCFLAAVMQHHDSHDQRAPCGLAQSQCRQQCAGRAAGWDNSLSLWSLLLVPTGIWCARACTAGFLKCPLAPQGWVRSIVLRLSTCPKCSQPGSWQLSLPGPFLWCCRWVLRPSSDFQTPLDLKFQNCLSDQLTTLIPPPDKQGLFDLEKRQ